MKCGGSCVARRQKEVSNVKYFYYVVDKKSFIAEKIHETDSGSFASWRITLAKGTMLYESDDLYFGISREYGLIFFWRTA